MSRLSTLLEVFHKVKLCLDFSGRLFPAVLSFFLCFVVAHFPFIPDRITPAVARYETGRPDRFAPSFVGAGSLQPCRASVLEPRKKELILGAPSFAVERALCEQRQSPGGSPLFPIFQVAHATLTINDKRRVCPCLPMEGTKR